MRRDRQKNPDNTSPFGRRGGRFGRSEQGRGHPFRGEGREQGGRRRKQFDAEALRAMVLALIGDGTAHGYELIRVFSDRSGGAYAPSPGMVYPLLTLLEELGQVHNIGEGARKSFALTDDGRQAVAAQTDETARLFARLDALAAEADRLDPTPVRRAMQNLKMALMNRLSKDDIDTDTIFAAVEKIDAVARDIERL